MSDEKEIVQDPINKKTKKHQKKVLTKEDKKRRRNKALIVVGSILGLIAVVISIFFVINFVGQKAILDLSNNFYKVEYAEGEQLTPVKDADGYWTFTTDNDLKIMQLTDVHIGGGFMSQKNDTWALNAVAAMVTAEKPDLVVVTGDIAFPVPYISGTFNNLSGTKDFATMMESLGVYWTFVFGNHDTEAYSYYSRKQICQYYESAGYKYCLFDKGYSSDELGYGNNIIKVKNSSGIVTQAIVLMDSHSYIDGDIFGMLWKYDNIHQSQVDWYSAEMDKLSLSNKNISGVDEVVNNLVFIHIPLVEYRDAWRMYQEQGETDDLKIVYNNYATGIDGLGEPDDTLNGVRSYRVYCGYGSDELFETGQEKGLKGVFCGHDHYNNFSVNYKGIVLTYGMSIDYLAYSGIWQQKAQRGCTLITVTSAGEFSSERSNYYQDKYVAQTIKQ